MFRRNKDKKNKIAQKLVETSQPIKTGYNKLEKMMIKIFSFFSDWFDRIVFNQKHSKLIAFGLGILMVASVTSQSDKDLFNKHLESAIKLKDIPVVTNINNNIYEVSGLPKKVTAVVTGDTNDVQGVSMNKDQLQVMADLSSLDEGSHLVKLTPINFSSNVDVELQPSSVNIDISKKVSKSFDVGYDFVNDNKLDKRYVLSKPQLSQNDVIVRASEDTINQISFVKALIDVNGVSEDFEENAPVVAYNQKGELMDVDIIPKMVKVKVNVTSPSKKVNVSIKPEGKMKDNLMIDSYELDTKELVLYGPRNVLDHINDIKLPLDVAGLTKNTTITTPVVLPTGVQTSNISKISVKINVGKAEVKHFNEVPIELKGNENGNMTLLDKNINVEVYGTNKNLANIKASDIRVYAEVKSNLSPGIYIAKLVVECNNPLVTTKLPDQEIRVQVK